MLKQEPDLFGHFIPKIDDSSLIRERADGIVVWHGIENEPRILGIRTETRIVILRGLKRFIIKMVFGIKRAIISISTHKEVHEHGGKAVVLGIEVDKALLSGCDDGLHEFNRVIPFLQ